MASLMRILRDDERLSSHVKKTHYNQQDTRGLTALHWAVRTQHLACTTQLLQASEAVKNS